MANLYRYVHSILKKVFFIFLLVMPTSVTQAEVFKCQLVSGKIVYQSMPCQSAAKQAIVEIKKSDPRKIAEAEAKFKAWEEDFAKREATRKKAEKERQDELDRQSVQHNVQSPYQQQPIYPYPIYLYYPNYPHYPHYPHYPTYPYYPTYPHYPTYPIYGDHRHNFNGRKSH
ncbi:MAG: hypothetical protein PHG00_09360 [Methylococcales bacterium]|nr:hypothetical protein [Methylococcales bacterium]